MPQEEITNTLPVTTPLPQEPPIAPAGLRDQFQAVLDAPADAEMSLPDPDTTMLRSALSGYLATLWDEAKRYKETWIEPLLLKNKRQREGDYDPVKLAAIREVGSSEIFMMITDTKVRAWKAWVEEIILQKRRMWGIEPTPDPEIPEHIAAPAMETFLRTITTKIANQYIDMGMQPDPLEIQNQVMEMVPMFEEEFKAALNRQSKKLSDKMENKIDDQLFEGGFYTALEEVIDDIGTYQAGFIKGPIFRKEKIQKIVTDPATGQLSPTVEEQIITQYERRSPFNIYPSPESTGINSGYLFDVIYLSRKQIYSLIGLPGFNEQEIRMVLNESRNGALNDWINLQQDTKEAMGSPKDETTNKQKIACLEFWGEVPGSTLLMWGMPAQDIPDKDADYDVCVWKIGSHVIKAMLNYDQFGKKPYSKASFDQKNDSFWGEGLPEKISDAQDGCNAAARALINNAGMASGPMVEENVDRFAQGETGGGVVPWRVWKVTESQMSSSAPALQFYTPEFIADKLIAVYNHFSKIADDHSGVPAYAHGDTSVGGAGNTLGGFSMMIGQAGKGIKQGVRNIDINIIQDVVQRQYNYNLANEELFGLVGDYKIVPKGFAALMAKEQQAIRKLELLNNSNNPVDLQIMGLDGRKELWREAFTAMEMDSQLIFPEGQPMLPAPPAAANPMPPNAGPETLDPAGNRVVGQDTRMNNPEKPKGKVSTKGDSGTANKGK